MTLPQQRELRGFDSYELRLGDELRGERACLGKSLFDVQRDLRIKACYIDAIENSDPAAIENQSFVAGYIRSYARYLKLDPEEVYRRFCEESGFKPARARVAEEARRTQDKPAISLRCWTGATGSTPAPPLAPARRWSRSWRWSAASVMAPGPS